MCLVCVHTIDSKVLGGVHLTPTFWEGFGKSNTLSKKSVPDLQRIHLGPISLILHPEEKSIRDHDVLALHTFVKLTSFGRGPKNQTN